MAYELFCGLTKNDDHPFKVNIEESLTVTDLKQAIQTANRDLADFAYHKLTLYRVDRGSEEKLNPYYKLSKVFEHAGPHEETMHILIVNTCRYYGAWLLLLLNRSTFATLLISMMVAFAAIDNLLQVAC
jgi:Crinkler effector protein N-terminal domain